MYRRSFLKQVSLIAPAYPSYSFLSKLVMTQTMLKRRIPSSTEEIPAVGLGTWIQFDVSAQGPEWSQLMQVLEIMIDQGGRLIDTSPMYGKAEQTIGMLTDKMSEADAFFYATKVWTSGEQAGRSQIMQSISRMRRERMDLIQIHNLLDWQSHMDTLIDLKAKGKIRYIGITHYTDHSHQQLANVIKQRPEIDFVQCNYSINGTHADQFLFDTAGEYDVAVIINTPFDGGALFRRVKDKPIPPWAGDLDINSWGQYFLKFILGHPAVTCVIPGTSNPKHLIDNMGAGYGIIPDASTRQKMKTYFDSI